VFLDSTTKKENQRKQTDEKKIGLKKLSTYIAKRFNNNMNGGDWLCYDTRNATEKQCII
jgi:hypothetical protein